MAESELYLFTEVEHAVLGTEDSLVGHEDDL